MEFLSKDPAKHPVEVKEKLTQRLDSRRLEHEVWSCSWSVNELHMICLQEEIQFLEELLDQMERS